MPIKYNDSGLDSSILNVFKYCSSHSDHGFPNLKLATLAASNDASIRSCINPAFVNSHRFIK